MVLILYSHLEGFIKSALINYAQYLNGLGRKREEFDFTLIATSMNREFKAYENKNSKSSLFNNKILQMIQYMVYIDELICWKVVLIY